MKVEQTFWSIGSGWETNPPGKRLKHADLVLLFGSSEIIRDARFLGSINATFPHAVITGCSTAGEIHDIHVTDETLTCTAIEFAGTRCAQAAAKIDRAEDSFHTGEKLAQQLDKKQLAHVLLLSDGLHVNGTELINGMQSALPADVHITGGLAADGENFKHTFVIAHGQPVESHVVAVGLYSDVLNIGFGSFGGWDPFGPERLITRSDGNILYELDGMSALSLYKKYLGDYANDLPASALLFPLAIRAASDSEERVRTILGIRNDENCMIFAGDIPEGHYARFMKCNMDRLIDGASTAAQSTVKSLVGSQNELALLVSCVGRKMVLRQRVEEEVEAVRDVLGAETVLTGFYSYGEISPIQKPGRCELLNQTMTITTLSEKNIE